MEGEFFVVVGEQGLLERGRAWKENRTRKVWNLTRLRIYD